MPAQETSKGEFLALSSLRLREAQALFDAGCYSGAYYLVGYAVEAALKAKIAGTFRAEVLPLPGNVSKIYVHDLTRLLTIADLADRLAHASRFNARLGSHWAIVQLWDEHSRYLEKSRTDAEYLIAAVGDPTDGVLAWLALNS